MDDKVQRGSEEEEEEEEEQVSSCSSTRLLVSEPQTNTGSDPSANSCYEHSVEPSGLPLKRLDADTSFIRKGEAGDWMLLSHTVAASLSAGLHFPEGLVTTSVKAGGQKR